MLDDDAASNTTIDHALRVWQEAVPARGSIVEAYLLSRGLSLLETDALRFHGRCPFGVGNGNTAKLPAMIALMRDVITNEPRAIHRTALKPDGSGRAEIPGFEAAKLLGASRKSAIKLDEDVTLGLVLTEGLETALAVRAMGITPVWVAGSATAVARFPVLPGVECLNIYGDIDNAGRQAARRCAERWQAARKECRILIPRIEHRKSA